MFSAATTLISLDPSGAEHLPMDILASQNLLNLGVILSMDGNDPMYPDLQVVQPRHDPVLATLMAQLRI